MWAHVAAGVITAWGDLPSLWWDGARQWDLRDPANIAPAGWVEVTPTDRPADTATTTQARETRRLARQVLRLSRVQTGDLTSADVGTDAT